MILFVGCATLPPNTFQAQNKRPPQSVRFLKAIDNAVDASGVNDASVHKIFGFPYLSIDRFLAALGPKLENQEQQNLWIDLMMRLNIASREKEIHNLPEREISRLTKQFKLVPGRNAVIDYIKIDAQGADLDIVKSAGNYMAERVIYITIEPENLQYENTTNSRQDIDMYMQSIGFVRHLSPHTVDPTYFNPRFSNYIKDHDIKIYQR